MSLEEFVSLAESGVMEKNSEAVKELAAIVDKKGNSRFSTKEIIDLVNSGKFNLVFSIINKENRSTSDSTRALLK